MAGNYPDAPANRMEIDRDGTVGASITAAGVITPLTTTQLQSLNDESDSTTVPTPGTNGFTALLFPEPRDLSAVFFSHSTGNATISVSSNTTNGFDGTWTTVLAAAARTLAVLPNYRSSTEALSSSNIIGIRTLSSSTGAPRSFHVYGKVSATNPDKLELWHPTLDQALYLTPAALDFGNIPRSTTADLTFRLKNTSASLAADTITLSTEALTDAATPTVVSGLTLSYDGGPFASTATLASLAANTVSPGIFALRNTPAANVTPGLWSQRIIATAASWI